MKAKNTKPGKTDAERLKLDAAWEDAARKLLATPDKSTPKREPKPRKKKGDDKKPKP